jgi:hypothetical protein
MFLPGRTNSITDEKGSISVVWGVLSLIVDDLAPTATQSPHLSLLGSTPTSIGNEQYALSVQPSTLVVSNSTSWFDYNIKNT